MVHQTEAMLPVLSLSLQANQHRLEKVKGLKQSKCEQLGLPRIVVVVHAKHQEQV